MDHVSLADFPDSFRPLVIVTGDRRERPPKTMGDLLAYSASTIDLTYCLQLGVEPGVDIVTDKTTILEEDKTLRELFGGKHVLCVGSPAVNLFSRRINDDCIFCFDIPETAKQDAAKHEQLIGSIRHVKFDLLLYQQFFEEGKKPGDLDLDAFGEERAARANELYTEFLALELNEPRWKSFIHALDLPGIRDPFEGKVHGKSPGRSNDFGVISLAPNPFAEGEPFFVIMVAGSHGLATAHGVKALSEPQRFERRPAGGVFEIVFPEYGGWHRRLQDAEFKWQTHPYDSPHEKYAFLATPEQRSGFGFFVSAPYDRHSSTYEELTQKIQRIAERHVANTDTPYTFTTAGRGDFPTLIQDRISQSFAMIHVLNEYGAGVLLEIGLSIGHQRDFFLLWDEGLEPFEFKDLPKCLQQVHTIVVDSTSKEGFDATVLNDLVKPALEHSDSGRTPSPAPTANPGKVLVHVSPSLNSQHGTLRRIVEDHSYSLLDETEVPRVAGHTNKLRHKIASAEHCVFMLDDLDRDGVIELGVAQALGKETILLAERPISMHSGSHIPITPSGEFRLDQFKPELVAWRRRPSTARYSAPVSSGILRSGEAQREAAGSTGARRSSKG